MALIKSSMNRACRAAHVWGARLGKSGTRVVLAEHLKGQSPAPEYLLDSGREANEAWDRRINNQVGVR